MHSNLFHNGCTVILLSFASKCGHSRSDFTFTVRKPKRTQCRIRVKNLPTLWLILELAEFFCTIALLDCHACVQGKRWRVGVLYAVCEWRPTMLCVWVWKGRPCTQLSYRWKWTLIPHIRLFFFLTGSSLTPPSIPPFPVHNWCSHLLNLLFLWPVIPLRRQDIT